jgi:chromate reductase
MKKIAVVVGSLRKDSINLKFAKALEKLAAGKMQFVYVNIGALPLFNQDLEGDMPAAVAVFKKEIDAADGVLIVTPEFNRGLPGVLKNAIDWGTRPYGKNSWAGKPAAICGASPGAIGTALAQAQFRAMSGFLDMPVMGQPEIYLTWKDGILGADGGFADERTKGFLQGFVDKFAEWVDIHGAAKKQAA